MRLKVLSILTVLLVLGAVGCAKDVQQQENIAKAIEVATQGLTEGGLRVLQKEAPEQVNEVLLDLQTVTRQARNYEDGTATVGDFANTLTDVFSRLNLRFELIPDSDSLDIVLLVFNTASQLVQVYIVDVAVPGEVADYIEAVRKGIETGALNYGVDLSVWTPPAPPTGGE